MFSHQIFVDGARSLAAVGDSPDYQGLPPAHVAGGKHPGCRTHVILIGLHIALSSSRNPSFSTTPLRAGPVNPMARSTRSASRANDRPATLKAGRRADMVDQEAGDAALGIAFECGNGNGPMPHPSLLMRALNPHHQGQAGQVSAGSGPAAVQA